MSKHVDPAITNATTFPPPTKTEVIAYAMKLNTGEEMAYRERHEAIWPELASALLDAGVLDFKIFLHAQTSTLFAIMERRLDNSLQDLRESELMKKWWAMMSDIMETNEDNSPTECDLQCMFHLTARS